MIKMYSEEKRKVVIEARQAGATIAQISAQTGVGQTTVKVWLIKQAYGFRDREYFKLKTYQLPEISNEKPL